MQKYNFYEFKGRILIENFQKNGSAPIDFSTHTRKGLNEVIKSVDTHNDNALFYQFKKCLLEMAADEETGTFQSMLSNWRDNSLKNILIYVDFSDVFPIENYAKKRYGWSKETPEGKKASDVKRCEALAESFFEKGFEILFAENQETVHYVPFEKSPSMARKSSMLFIDSRFYEKMEQRLRLGFNFSGDKIPISKLYAYTGLYLSDAKRISEMPDFVLNEETVIVLPDKTIRTFVPAEVISGDKAGITYINDLEKWPIRCYAAGTYETTVNYFDGEGLISPRYCAIINSILQTQYGMSGTAASLQIRMPFTKGLLHQVDFHKFICEKLQLTSCRDVRIIDAYGRHRDLEKAQIVLTESMFKIKKWLGNSKISSVEPNEDPMALYFSRFHEYDHAFYVGNTDMNLSQAGTAKLNYQFLDTLALSEENLTEIIEEHTGFATRGNPKAIVRDLVSDSQDEYADGDFDEEAPAETANWCAVAAKNPAFLKDPKVKGMLNGIRLSLLKDVGLGRLRVSGSTKFLSRDLMVLLAWMIEKIETVNGRSLSEDQKKKIKKECRKESFGSTKFFVADSIPKNPVFANEHRKLSLKAKTYYGILRSPHLSRNEQCSLSPFIPRTDDVFSRYFGHLKGILMVSEFSFVPQALSGADFDGDMVKLITDKRICDAINLACYHPDAAGQPGTEENADTVKDLNTIRKHSRKLPIIMIPDTNPRSSLLPENRTDFKTIQDTFSSQVGQLSNHAFSLGKRQYDEKSSDTSYKLSCETGTILVGLEIDAAKTGRHPHLEDYLLKEKGKDYFIARKEELKKLPKLYSLTIKDKSEDKKEGKPHRLSAMKNDRELTYGAFTEDYPGEYYLIDRLPYLFLSRLSQYKAPAASNDGDCGFRFDFEQNPDWKKQVSNAELKDLVENLIYSYRRIDKTASLYYQNHELLKQSNYVGCLNRILKLQYMEILSDDKLKDFQEKIFLQLLDSLVSYEKTETVLKKLVEDRQWLFIENNNDKILYIENLLFDGSGSELDKDVREALINFRWNGYCLLYYYIKDILLEYLENDTDLQADQAEEKNDFSDKPSRFYEEFRQIYQQSLAAKESSKIWKRKITDRCRGILQEAFHNQVRDALMYTHEARNRCDKYGKFFWDVFTTNEILQN